MVGYPSDSLASCIKYDFDRTKQMVAKVYSYMTSTNLSTFCIPHRSRRGG